MAKSEWIDDSYYNARYYVDENGVYVTGTRKIDGKAHQFQSNGKWIGEVPISRGFEKGKYTKTVFLDQDTVVKILVLFIITLRKKT